MELYPKKKTDDEYVEATRRLVKQSKWIGVLLALGAICQLVLFWILWKGVYSIKSDFAEMDQGIHIGIMLGAICGLFLTLAAHCIILAIPYFIGQRTEQLMIKYYDELLRQTNASNKTNEAIASSAAEPAQPHR